MPVKKVKVNKKALIVFAIIIASLLTIGSALAYYGFQKEIAENRPLLKRPQMNQMRKRIQKNKPVQGLLKGEVTDKSDNLLILNTGDEDWKINLSDKTRYREDGQKITKDDITVGDQISVFGKRDIKNKSIEAILIRKMGLAP